MLKIISFDIPAENPVRAIAFYGSVFGLEFKQVSTGSFAYWKITNGPPGIECGMTKRDGPGEGYPNAFVCTFEVDSVEKFEKKIAAAGGRVVIPKLARDSVGWTLICKDTEGNTFQVLSKDKAASPPDPLFQ